MKKFISIVMLLCMAQVAVLAQRVYQKMGRGVVAITRDAGKTANVSWRKLTNDPDSCTYNLYMRQKGAAEYIKVNTEPLRKTFVQITGAKIPYGSELAVTTVSAKGVESDKSTPYLYKQQPWNNVWMYIEYDNTVLKRDDYVTKYVWPCDLNGDGEMNQFIVDRLGGGVYEEEDGDEDTPATDGGTNHKIQAYDIDGTLLWTVALGPNVNICAGHNDMVTVADIDCDGKCEVIIRSSDGTRFWDKKNETWGKYVFGKDTPDVDGDGIVDYAVKENTKRNPPFYITVIDGMTGEEKVSAELKYDEVTDGVDSYSRDNRSDYMSNNGYYQMGGHFAVCYDGVRPYLAMKCLDRSSATGHHDYVFAFGYDWTNGKPSNFRHFYTWSRNDKTPWPAEFHGNRVCDVDGDGIDEIVPGCFAVNPWKDMVCSPGVGHGDRFTLTDIDPTRPGLEQYAIQQSGLLGQLIYDAATGEKLKEWYLPSVGDVARGQCQDVDSTHPGLECYSYVSEYIYDCKGHKLDTKRTAPCEPVWWDGDLLREALNQRGGSGRTSNLYIEKVPSGSRIFEMFRESDFKVHGHTGTRPGFYGDITGDWREEVILMHQDATTSTGIVGYTTHVPTEHVITALLEDGHYRGDVSCRGYYQSPNTGFYLAHGMKKEPLFDCIVADLRYQDGWNFTSYDQTEPMAYADGKSLIFDITGANASPVALTGELSPEAVYLMNPKGHDYTFQGPGHFSGAMVMKKGMQGRATFNTDLMHKGQTIIAEGTLEVNGKIESPLYLMSRGTLAGNPVVNAPIAFEGALNYAGCRLMAGTAADKFGTITINHNVTIPGDVYIETDLETATGKADRFVVNGNLTFAGTNYFTVNVADGTASPGTYTLAECTGTLTVNAEDIVIRNLTGVPFKVKVGDKKIEIAIDEQREATDGVVWTGKETATWNYLFKNFAVGGEDSYFVTGDKVVFDDSAAETEVTVDGEVVTNGIEFRNDTKTFTFRGDGAFGGSGDLVKNGKGEVRLELENSNYTGRTIINYGRLTVLQLSDAGKSSSIGSAAAVSGNLQINGGELCMAGDNVATDRPVTISDTATINISKAGSSLTLKGQVSGAGVLVKDGPGQLNLNNEGTNGFDALVVRDGIIMQGHWKSTFGKAGAPITFYGGTLRMRDNQSMSTIPHLTNPMTFVEGTESTVRGSYRCGIDGAAFGKGTVTFVSGGVRCDVRTDFSQFEGVLQAQGAEFRLQSDVTDMKKLVFRPLGSVAAEISSELHIGSLTGEESTPQIKGKPIYVGYLNDTCTYAGILRSNTVYKVGTGVWELTGTQSESGIVVREGTLKIRNFTGRTTSSSITVETGGTLAGRGSTQSILLRRGSVLAPGVDSNTVGTLATTGNFIAYGGSTLLFKIDKTQNDMLKSSGTIRLSGDTIRILPINGRTFADGESIRIFDGNVNGASKWVIDGGSYDWDDTLLASSGVLVCRGTSDVGCVTVDESDNTRYFDINGIEIEPRQMKRGKVYIERKVKGGVVTTLKIRK